MFEQIVNEANDIVLVAEIGDEAPGFRIAYINEAFCRLFGYSRTEVLGKSPRILHGPQTSLATIDEISAVVHQGGSIRRRVLNYTKSGEPVWVEVNIVPLAAAVGGRPRFAAIERDVSAEVEREHGLELLAFTDPLTKLPNRRHSDDVIRRELSRGVRTQAPVSLAMLDIDHFKAVNDAWGHYVGDQVLVAVAGAIRDAIRDFDHAARVGGEEFLVMLPGTDLTNAFRAIERVCAAISSRGVRVGNQMIRVTCSGGVACSTGPNETVTSLMQRADRALYSAKKGGRNQVCAFDGDSADDRGLRGV